MKFALIAVLKVKYCYNFSVTAAVHNICIEMHLILDGLILLVHMFVPKTVTHVCSQC